MSVEPKIIDLAKKLKALAEKGVGGEKMNAERMLSDLMKKHKITEADINGEEIKDFFWKMTEPDFTLWYQCIKKVNYNIPVYGPFPQKEIKRLLLEGNHMISCTIAEKVEIECMFETYKRLYIEEVDIFFLAFCRANDLLVDHPEKSHKPLSEEDAAKYDRAATMSGSIEKRTHRKQLKK